MKVGYIRISTVEQNETRQEVLMQNLGVEKVFLDKLSGKNTERPELQALLAYVREVDTVIVESISRFARNTKDFLNLIEELDKKKVAFISQKENIDTNTASGRFMMTVFAALAELERSTILVRQAEGIAIAKEEGKYKGRQPIKIDQDKFAEQYRLWKEGMILPRSACKKLGISYSTFKRRVKEYEENSAKAQNTDTNT